MQHFRHKAANFGDYLLQFQMLSDKQFKHRVLHVKELQCHAKKTFSIIHTHQLKSIKNLSHRFFSYEFEGASNPGVHLALPWPGGKDKPWTPCNRLYDMRGSKHADGGVAVGFM